MDDLVELTLMYDFYGELLTGKQRRVFELYYMENHSLNEIAENHGISRQAVSELLGRVKAKLMEYEKKVGYLAFYQKLSTAVQAESSVPASIRELL